MSASKHVLHNQMLRSTYMMLILFKTLILLIYLAFLLNYIFKSPKGNLHLPSYYMYASALLFFTVYSVSRWHYFLEADNPRRLIRNLVTVLFAGIIFLIMQMASWAEFNEILSTETNTQHIQFLLLTGFYYTILFLILLFVTAHYTLKYAMAQRDAVKWLILVTNPSEHFQIRMLSQSWYFLQAVWILHVCILHFLLN